MSAGAGWDWVLTISAAAGSGATTLFMQLFLEYTDKPDRIEGWVEKDQEYRAELATKLRGSRIGTNYRDFLTRGLDWLDRNWGEAGSAKALGICIIIGLCYAYAAFLSPGVSALRARSGVSNFWARRRNLDEVCWRSGSWRRRRSALPSVAGSAGRNDA